MVRALAAGVLLVGLYADLTRRLARRERRLDLRHQRLCAWSRELEARERLVGGIEIDRARWAAADELLERALGPDPEAGV